MLSALIAALALTGTGEAQGVQPAGERAKNVIIFIGDGMGTSQRDLIRYATVGTEGQLAMDSMPYAGRSETSPLDPEAFVTDSAAGGTAIATGVKTFNGAVGIDVDENPVPTVLERARDAGKATGLVSNSQITDATPASFGAHIANRDKQSEIARQYIEESKPDVILGVAKTTGTQKENPAHTPTSLRWTPRRRVRALRATWSKRHGTSVMST